MFDVSDFANPKEMFTEIIGARGSYSELINNHKSLLYSKERNIFAFPATVCEKEYSNEWSGFLNYSIDMEKGFTLEMKVSHYSGEYGYNYEMNISRGVYAGDNLYTFSANKIMAHSLSTKQLIGEINLDQ